MVKGMLAAGRQAGTAKWADAGLTVLPKCAEYLPNGEGLLQASLEQQQG
jgi:hypothetical protein